MRNPVIRLLAACTGLAFLSACTKEEPVPSWIYVPEVKVVTADGEGTDRQKITELYVYTTSSFLGAFPIPGHVPVLETGDVVVDLFPGIRANGIKATPDIYPFLSRSRHTLHLQPGSRDTLLPVFSYDPLARIRLIEDFEGSVKWFHNAIAGHPLEITAGDEFEGKAGTALVDETEPIFEVSTDAFPDLPQNGTPIYLEMHYKCEVPFLIGLDGSNATIPTAKQYIAGVNARDDWNKIYFSLTDAINLSDLDTYKLLIRCDLPINGSVTSGRIWIDNIKLIHQ